MRLFYLDESGNTGTQLDAQQPIHWIVAIGFSPTEVKQVEDAMLLLALKYFPNQARRASFEFHGGDLFSGRGECQALRVEQRVALYGELLGLLKPNNAVIFVHGIDKQLHQQRAVAKNYLAEHPHKLAAMYLCERIDEWLEKQSTSQQPIYGLLVADEQKEVDRDMAARFADWRNFGTDFGYRPRKLRFLLDTIHFVPSHNSWLIQLADCVAYVRNRHAKVLREKGSNQTNYTQSEKAIARFWDELCWPRVINDLVWPA